MCPYTGYISVEFYCIVVQLKELKRREEKTTVPTPVR